MAEYIEREALIAAYDAAHKGPPGGARKLMVDAPAADVAPISHGQWLDDQYFWRCSVCLEWLEVAQGTANMNYCPHCGARMDGE